jgi:hypothetical protein
MDPDPEDPKTYGSYGSGSATLVRVVRFPLFLNVSLLSESEVLESAWTMYCRGRFPA